MILQKCSPFLLWLMFFSLCSLFAVETFEKKKQRLTITLYSQKYRLLQVVTLLRLRVGVPTHDNHSWYVIFKYHA